MHTFTNEIVKERPGNIMVVDEELDPNLKVTGVAAKLTGWGRFPFSSRTPAPPVPYPPRARVPQELLDRLDIAKLAKEFKGL